MEFLKHTRLMVAVLGGHLLLAGVGPAHAQTDSVEAVKAAYLFRFAGYVNWPAETTRYDTFLFEVMDAPGVARELRRLLPGHLVHELPVEERELQSLADLGHPKILYIGPGHSAEMRRVLALLARIPVLIVTDEVDGLDVGGVLNFVMFNHRVRFEASLTAAEREHLRISADLLALAVRVRGSPHQSRGSCVQQNSLDSACTIREACDVRPGASPPRVTRDPGAGQ